MEELYKTGRYFFGIAIIAFGIIQFVTGDFMSGLLPVYDNLPGRRFFLYLISTVFLVGGLAILWPATYRRATLLMGFLFSLLVIYPHLVRLISDIHHAPEWTVIAETLAFSAGAFIIVGDYPNYPIGKTSEPLFPKLLRTGHILFAITLFVFAVQHFMYADYIATLITSWIPFPLFWSYFVGVAFLAGCISILTNIKTRLACTLLGFMFLFWVIFLHAPRVFANALKESEWSSMFIALGFCGIFFTLARQYARSIK